MSLSDNLYKAGGQSEEDSIALIHRAFELGVTLLDSSDL